MAGRAIARTATPNNPAPIAPTDDLPSLQPTIPGSPTVRQLRPHRTTAHWLGTQRAEENARQLFKDTPVYRIDRDTTRSNKQLNAQLEQINRGEPCVLVGTQMLAKGHHFPNVTLVAVINADAGLLSPDFRAPERTAQLIVQVAGRAGRRSAW